MNINEINRYINSVHFRKKLYIKSEEKIYVKLLGQGEYNINYVFRNPDDSKKLVFRLNTESQMNLKDQIGYEFGALKILEDSNRTPKAIYVDSSKKEIPYGFLIMDFLEGEPLEYSTDLEIAAECLADIHSLKIPDKANLIRPTDPLKAVLNECKDMSSKYLKSDLGDFEIKMIIKRLIRKAEKMVYNDNSNIDKSHIINTELNSGNFLINGKNKQNYIIDWEKPIFGEVEQDIGHFLAPTTTFWKTDTFLNREEINNFIEDYINKVNGRFDASNIHKRVDKYLTINCLRGITWCSMAWVEYQNPDKTIRNEFTYNKST